MRCHLLASLALAVALPALALAPSPARADDAQSCQAGVEMIRAEIAKNPAEPLLKKLQKSLAEAEREMKEAEFDECVEAVEEAKEALKKK
ncbi:hypothetical protein [Azospirillum sp. SYSU D00513]|uniref:hypothetical protein n=1 Tax=Azospirillum sp. SYSU D00513 TaxID=2812561 RepID=UPI001A964143|nr:hypothetical protein [Azospirillum sp. SYSU D00513]